MLSLSPAEIQFAEDGIRDNIRADGRGRLHYRPFSIETGLITQTNGSARLVLDNTQVLVGVKAEIGEPNNNRPNEGRILVSVECCPSASPEFEGRGGTALNVELSTVIQRYLESGSSIDRKKLCIVPGQHCWVLYVDTLVLDSSGNLFDAISFAIRAALSNTQIPEIKVVPSPESGKFEFELDADKTFGLSVANVPVCVTMTKIGNHHIVDATLEEELCRGCRVTFAVNSSGICSMQKGTGTISPHGLTLMLQSASAIGKILIEKIDSTLAIEKEKKSLNDTNQQGFGFFV